MLMTEVKKAEGHDLCSEMAGSVGRDLTCTRMAEAITRGPDAFSAYQPELPMTVSVACRTEEDAVKVAARPGVRRMDAVTVETMLERWCDVVKWILDVGR